MQDCFKCEAGIGIFKYTPPHQGSVERSVRGEHPVAKFFAYWRQGTTTGAGNRMGDGIGIDNVGASPTEQFGNR